MYFAEWPREVSETFRHHFSDERLAATAWNDKSVRRYNFHSFENGHRPAQRKHRTILGCKTFLSIRIWSVHSHSEWVWQILYILCSSVHTRKGSFAAIERHSGRTGTTGFRRVQIHYPARAKRKLVRTRQKRRRNYFSWVTQAGRRTRKPHEKRVLGVFYVATPARYDRWSNWSDCSISGAGQTDSSAHAKRRRQSPH